MLKINQRQSEKIKQMEKQLAELKQKMTASSQMQSTLDYACSVASGHLKRKSLPTIYESESPIKRRNSNKME